MALPCQYAASEFSWRSNRCRRARPARPFFLLLPDGIALPRPPFRAPGPVRLKPRPAAPARMRRCARFAPGAPIDCAISGRIVAEPGTNWAIRRDYLPLTFQFAMFSPYFPYIIVTVLTLETIWSYFRHYLLALHVNLSLTSNLPGEVADHALRRCHDEYFSAGDSYANRIFPCRRDGTGILGTCCFRGHHNIHV